ncbi:MAG TPA: cysteine desulfurase family protein, partial [Saprospiraceae bacterium]|nr:cysteine desulfurase family protein [Saprospiraceae bacterium]
FFTSGSTESLNMTIKGLADNLSHKGKHIVTVSTEHAAVLDPLKWLSKKGFEIEALNVNEFGLLDVDQLGDAIRDDTIMVVIMWANNETGVLHDVKAIGEICRHKNVAFVCDATQAAGKLIINAIETGIDILALSAHKFYGPKGTGAMYIAKNEKKLQPAALIHGGGHENGYRSGTLNVPGIVGLGKAAEIGKHELESDIKRARVLRDGFEKDLLENCEHVDINGGIEHRLETVSNIKVAHVDSQAIMTKLRSRISISSGSACSSADPAPSHVLLAMGLGPAEAKGSFRISFGRQTTVEEASFAAECLVAAIQEYREQSPVWQMFKQGIDIGEDSSRELRR